jgi:hypothetical protein
MKVTCSQEIDLPSFQTALGLALFDPSQPRLEYRVLAVKYDDQQLQSTAPFKWVQAGGESGCGALAAFGVWGFSRLGSMGACSMGQIWGLRLAFGYVARLGFGQVLEWRLGFRVKPEGRLAFGV